MFMGMIVFLFLSLALLSGDTDCPARQRWQGDSARDHGAPPAKHIEPRGNARDKWMRRLGVLAPFFRGRL